MKDSFFSDREQLPTSPNSEDISRTVFNGIIALYEKNKIYLSKSFPEYCPDHDGTICGFNSSIFIDQVNAYIPKMNYRPNMSYDELIDKYAVLDFIEYIYTNIWDYKEGSYHSFFNHNHLSFPGSEVSKKVFQNDINRLFMRNYIVFYLDAEGQIKRSLPLEMNTLISQMKIQTSDTRLNELIHEAIINVSKPNLLDRLYSIEKLWDAFERMKTFFSSKKNISADRLFATAGNSTDDFYDLLVIESKTLTDIGNKYQIRHFETDKIQIRSTQHIDYLFYRMLALIHLCIQFI